MARREFSKAVLRAALARADGRCEGVLTDGNRCPCALQVGRFHYDHIVPAALTEDASLENCQVLCRPCHAAKTVGDVGVIARVRRVRDRHVGIADPHRRPIPGGKASPFKRLIGGGVICRDTGERLDRGGKLSTPKATYAVSHDIPDLHKVQPRTFLSEYERFAADLTKLHTAETALTSIVEGAPLKLPGSCARPRGRCR